MCVLIQGVPAYGIIASRADITIMGGAVFKQMATAARQREFMAADKTPRLSDQCSFVLDGRIVLDLSFGDKTMRTPIYLKMDAPDQLLLSEGMCR